MRKTMKWFFSICFSMVLLFGLPNEVWALESTDNTEIISYEDTNAETGYHIYIDDYARLLTDSEKKQLAEVMEPISNHGNVAFVSIDYNPEYSTERYAEEYFLDRFGYSSGTVFVIDLDERYIWIYSDGALYKTITSSYANTITDNVYDYASDEEYFICASEAFEQMNSLLEGKRIAQPMKYISNALLSIVLALLINYFFVMASSRSHKATDSQLLNGIFSKVEIRNPHTEFVNQTKRYSPQSSSSSGGGGGGHSGGGGGGGGGHRF